MTEFYVLDADGGFFGVKWAYGEKIDPIILGEVDRCPVCHGIVSSKPWLPPYKAKLSSAKPEKWGDFLWVGGTSLAVSKRFREVYERESLKGIDSFTEPIEIVRYGTRKTGDLPIKPPEYYVIRIPWGGENQDDNSSEVIYLKPDELKCNYCRARVMHRTQPHIFIDIESWNGSDIFRPRGTPVTEMVSERFYEVCKRHQFTGALLIPGSEFGYDSQRYPPKYINR
jgi:hypothetical protein